MKPNLHRHGEWPINALKQTLNALFASPKPPQGEKRREEKWGRFLEVLGFLDFKSSREVTPHHILYYISFILCV